MRYSNTVTLVCDTTGPRVTSVPRATLRVGTASTSNLPVVVRWASSDLSGIYDQTPYRLPTGSSAHVNGVARAASLYARPGANRYALYSRDTKLNSSRAYGPYTTARVDSQSVRRGYSTGWKATRVRYSFGGTEQVTTRRSAKVSYTVTARSVAWVATKARNRGVAAVYVDGRRVATVDLRRSSTALRQQV